MTHLMIIGGTDSSGGAGLSRDTATASQLGVEVCPVVTAVTAQTNTAVTDISLMPPPLIAEQIAAAFQSAPIQVVKIGMLGSPEIAETVARNLADKSVTLVLDPVLKSSSGSGLMSGHIPDQLMTQVDLITPNLCESATLTNSATATSEAQIASQSKSLLSQGAKAVLIKGGHSNGAEATDHLFTDNAHHRFSAPMLPVNKRGTGCTLATAIACHLAKGHDLPDACKQAKSFVRNWLKTASVPALS